MPPAVASTRPSTATCRMTRGTRTAQCQANGELVARLAPCVSSNSARFTTAIADTRLTAAISTHRSRLTPPTMWSRNVRTTSVCLSRPPASRVRRPSAVTLARLASGFIRAIAGSNMPRPPPVESTTGSQKRVSGDGNSKLGRHDAHDAVCLAVERDERPDRRSAPSKYCCHVAWLRTIWRTSRSSAPNV